MHSKTTPTRLDGDIENGAEINGNYRRTLSDYHALDRALLASDLSGACTAFTRLQVDLPGLATSLSGDPFRGENSHLRALRALGRCLLSGNLQRAKRAFRQFH
jgi:hypothetical protein